MSHRYTKAHVQQAYLVLHQ